MVAESRFQPRNTQMTRKVMWCSAWLKVTHSRISAEGGRSVPETRVLSKRGYGKHPTPGRVEYSLG